MADIAAIFHWSLDALAEMSVADLMLWQARAIDRFNAMNGG